jgi:RimJ/RimL family protein N-acetyltransferase
VSDDPIVTDRLRLELIRMGTIRALLRGDRAEAERLQGAPLPDELVGSLDERFLTVQLKRLEAAPQSRAWCVRLMRLRDGGDVVGDCGFHGPPHLTGRAEIGYKVLSKHRRRGYATEAAAALVAWAHAQGEATVFASVAPANAASLAVVRRVGFRQTGTQMDEIDGEELVFEVGAGA